MGLSELRGTRNIGTEERFVNDLQKLALDRIMELGQEVMTLHGDLERWRDTPLTDNERLSHSVRLKQCLEMQNSWARAISEYDADV
jgi:hypothetical protein